MKWNFAIPYKRETESLFHYPEVSRVNGKPIDWYNGEAVDGYEGARIYGEHTLELHGMPLGRTPEYVQERLRRFFSKFGPVKHCRAEPHPWDPYQCEGTAFVTFRDKQTALKALQAPLKFPASLHDKVVSMRHLDSDKCNDADYHEKSKFWNNELISVARQLHVQLSRDPTFCAQGKPLSCVGLDILERELVTLPATAASELVPQGRGGVPLSKGLFGTPTRMVPAGPAVRRRFGAWEAFLAEPPLDLLFSLDSRPMGASSGAENNGAAEAGTGEVLVVRPRLVSLTQRARILTRLKMALSRRLHSEFSIWWREGKIPLPEYTQRRVTWWDHKPKLPFDVQIQSRSRKRHRIFDERFLYKMQLLRARNEKRRERRSEWTATRARMMAEKKEALKQRREQALEVVNRAKCGGLLGSASSRNTSELEARSRRART